LRNLGSASQSKTLKPLEDHDRHIIRLWHDISSAAIQANVSDIHIEAHQQSCVIRFRILGDLHLFKNCPKEDHARLIARIKILAKLDIAEQRLPQDGRLTIHGDHTPLEFDGRVSTMPTLYGEKVVIRLLNTAPEELNLNHIGLTDSQLTIVKRSLVQSHGLILVCGPTGSGKTRTLYSFLQFLNQGHRNLCSIEDPIEIRLKGVNQVAYHPRAGLTFGVIIRALLRQDPDVMMIGEIRDAETATLAMSAAQTGHLVLSTIHTRTAISCIERLRHFGIEPYLIAQNILFISSQRLIKRIDQHPKEGRIAVHEILQFTHALSNAIESKVNTSEIEKIARNQGYCSMQEHARRLVLHGVLDQLTVDHEMPK
jgi:type II secretory ATPase GspE/PulE/Tfp pilus assembly ATPase PilB-like protein